jgi:uracil-DNA glycosylase
MDVEKLKELHGKCSNCKQCNLNTNGHKPPIWYHNAPYVLFMEQPAAISVHHMNVFWKMAGEYNLKEEQFMQIYTVQCRTPKSGRSGKKRPTIPSQMHREICRRWVMDYLSAMQPKKMLALGNVVMQELTGHFNGITTKNATVIAPKYGGFVVPTVLSVSPAAMRYKGNTEDLIRASFKCFKEI